MAYIKKNKVKTVPVSNENTQGIYGINANKTSLGKKERNYIHGSELTGTVK